MLVKSTLGNVYYDVNSNTIEIMDSGTPDEHVDRGLYDYMRLERALSVYAGLKREFTPVTLFIEPSKICNLNCSYCYAHRQSSNAPIVSYDKVKKVLLKYPSIRQIDIFGGEPLMQLEMIRKIHEDFRDVKIFISTNGLLLEKLSVIELNELDMQVSLEPDTWGNRVDWNGKPQISSLDSSLKFLSARALRGNPVHFLIPTPSSVPADFDYVGFVEGLAKKIESWNFTVSWTPLNDDDKCPDFTDVLKQMSFLYENQFNKFQLLANKLPPYKTFNYFEKTNGAFSSINLFNCNMINADLSHNISSSMLSISPNGKLYACHEQAVNENGLTAIGEVGDEVVVDRERQKKIGLEYLKKYNSREYCPICSLKYLCGGLCHFMESGCPRCTFFLKTFPMALSYFSIPQYRRMIEEFNQKSMRIYNSLEDYKGLSSVETLLLNGDLDPDKL